MGFYFLDYAMVHLNIPNEILKQVAHGGDYKAIKERKELLALAIWFKVNHSNSSILNVSKYNLMKWLRIGKIKAKRLIAQMKESDNFTVKGTGVGTYHVWVASFHDKADKRRGKDGRIYRAENCCLFEVDKNYSLKDIYALINEKLMLLPISSASRKDGFVEANKKKNPRCVANPVRITLNAFASTIGMSRGSVSTLKKKLIGKGVFAAKPAEKHMTDLRNAALAAQMLLSLGVADFTYRYGDFGYVLIPCSYSITDVKGTGYKHRFYNYKSRNEYRNALCNPKKRKVINGLIAYDPDLYENN